MLYLLQVNIGLILFYASYKLLCTRDTFFHSRRFILMVSLVLPFILPLIDIREWMESRDSLIMLTHFDYSVVLPEIVVGSKAAGTGNQVFILSEWIKYIYLAGIALLTIRFFIQVISLYRIILHTPTKMINGICVKCLKNPSGPFSFFGWIFMNPTVVKENEMDEILTHELAHVKQKHSIDILIAEIVSICCWINPFVWLIKREVRLNLEFLADKKVMEAGFSTKSYQYHLLGLAYNHKYGLSNNFNFSHLKQRIIMMNKKNQMVQRILNMHCSPFRPLLYSLPETSPVRRMHQKRQMQKKKLSHQLVRMQRKLQQRILRKKSIRCSRTDA